MTIGKHVFAGTGNSAVLETDASNMVQLVNREGPLGVWFRVPGDPSTATKEHVWPNLHGDLGATSDDHGNRTAAFTYDEFGNADQAPPANSASERWTGQYRKQTDSATGLTLMGATRRLRHRTISQYGPNRRRICDHVRLLRSRPETATTQAAR